MSKYLEEKIKPMSPENRFLYWIEERELIRALKTKGRERPWTDDPILSSYRFCNVRRMDDKVSRWLLENWYKPYFNHPNMLQAVACARFFNKPEALAQITSIVFSKGWKPQSILKTLRDYRDKGNTVFNGAYMVRGNDGIDKIDCVLNHYINHLWEVRLDTTSMDLSHQTINACYGFGSFMAGQIVADLRWAIDGTWRDKRSWAPQGPGSTRGICRLYGEKPTPTGVSTEEFKGRMAYVIELVASTLPRIYKKLEGIDVQNCLCEYDKYERALWGQGRPKSKYQGGTPS